MPEPEKIQFVSRRRAAEKIRAQWLVTLTPPELLAMTEPTWLRMRNYEYEVLLSETFGGEWVIKEWCPFNGRYCAWGDHAPEAANV